ncbi:MAG TPA: hypothetical protein PK843_18490 [bacterium]|nr:hypothetical protein [bacterium]
MKSKMKWAMSFALLVSMTLALPLIQGGVSLKDHQNHFNASWYVISPCTGERINVSSSWNFLIKERYDKNGVVYVLTHISEQGSKGVGETSGIQFNVTGNDQDHESAYVTLDNKIEYTDRFIEILNFISPGNEYNFKIILILTLSGVYNPQTDMWETLEVKQFIERAECH